MFNPSYFILCVNVISDCFFACRACLFLFLTYQCKQPKKNRYFLTITVCSVTVFLNPFHLFFSTPDCLCSLRSLAPFLLLGSLYLDVPGRGAALHHAGGGFWEWALQDQVLLPGRIWSACCHSGRICCGGLQELWHWPSVRTKRVAKWEWKRDGWWGKGGRLECLLSFWLCLPQWSPQAVALLKHQYREDESGREDRRGGKYCYKLGRLHHRMLAWGQRGQSVNMEKFTRQESRGGYMDEQIDGEKEQFKWECENGGME